MVKIHECEVGPHFLTFYGEEAPDLFELAKKFQVRFNELRPELERIQQKDLAHEKNDPRVYHPYGHPTPFPKQNRPVHKASSHFHVRYAYRPSQADIDEALALLDELGADISEIETTDLEDQKAHEWTYPEVPVGSHEDYLEWIQDIRDNKYDSKVE